LREAKIITLFPDFFTSPLDTGLLGKAVRSGIVAVRLIDLREYSADRFRRCDDYPYGGGSGMVLRPEPLFRAIAELRREPVKVLLTSAGGRLLDQAMVKELAAEESLCIVCGHYEGIDQRFIDRHVDYEVSIGDYVVSGGEYAALVILDAIARYTPGFMSNPESLVEESFEDHLLEYPHYTRPVEIEGLRVPEVLISGDHGRVERWRREQRIEKTKRVRPDLYDKFLKKERGEET